MDAKELAAVGKSISERVRNMTFRDLPVPKATTPRESTVLPSVPHEKNQGSILIVEIPLDLVLESAFQPRRQNTAKKDIEDLAKNIAANGQLQPIIVTPAEGENAGKYHVQSGHRRCAALRSLGLSTVKAIIRADLTPREARKIAIADNLGREDLSGYEQAMSLAAYAEEFKIEIAAAAEEIGLTKRHSSRLRGITKASPGLLEILRDTGISARASEHLVEIDATDSKKAARLAQRLVEGAVTLKDIEAQTKGPKQKTRKLAAVRDVEIRIEKERVRLALNVPRVGLDGAQREKVVDALMTFMWHAKIGELHARENATSEQGR